MNKNIDLTKILKNCPNGFELYSIIHGKVMFKKINDCSLYPIIVSNKEGGLDNFTADGKMLIGYDGECCLFPSKYCRDWSKFIAPWYKKDRFDPRTFKPFDKIIARVDEHGIWCCEWFSFIEEKTTLIKGCGAYYRNCIPYNDDTKYLIGTTEDAPEYYRYWED